jgi:hypothetical protein
MTELSVASLSPGMRGSFVDHEGWPIVPPTLVSIHRTSSEDERSRQVVCALDGRRVAELLFRQSATIEIPPGCHVLQVHNTLMWRRVPFTALPGSHHHFTVVNRAPAGFYPLLLIIGVAPLILSVRRG